MKSMEIIMDSLHGLTKGKPWLTNLIAFYKGVTSFVDDRSSNGYCCLSYQEPLQSAKTILGEAESGERIHYFRSSSVKSFDWEKRDEDRKIF